MEKVKIDPLLPPTWQASHYGCGQDAAGSKRLVSSVLSSALVTTLDSLVEATMLLPFAQNWQVQSLIPPGVSITLNSLCINPRQFGFQFPLQQEMKHQ
jgi:hypothetical protein